jgi:hypothetical protein
MKIGRTLTAAAFALTAAATGAQARDHIKIVGSSTVFPYTQAVAEEFASETGSKSPVVESTGTGGGMKIFCQGVGADHPDLGFTPRELHEKTGIPRGSVGTTLARLEARGLVRHKEPYWAVNQLGIEAYDTVLTSLEAVESTTTYDWGDEDPADHRIGLEAVTIEEPDADA